MNSTKKLVKRQPNHVRNLLMGTTVVQVQLTETFYQILVGVYLSMYVHDYP